MPFGSAQGSGKPTETTEVAEVTAGVAAGVAAGARLLKPCASDRPLLRGFQGCRRRKKIYALNLSKVTDVQTQQNAKMRLQQLLLSVAAAPRALARRLAARASSTARPDVLPVANVHRSNAQELVSAVKVIEVDGHVALCDGGAWTARPRRHRPSASHRGVLSVVSSSATRRSPLAPRCARSCARPSCRRRLDRPPHRVHPARQAGGRRARHVQVLRPALPDGAPPLARVRARRCGVRRTRPY